MKSFLILTMSLIMAASLIFIPNNSEAQIVRTLAADQETLTNTDTAYITLSVVSNSVSAEAYADKVSGTVAGTMVLQGSVDGTNYDDITSHNLVNQAINYKVFALHNSSGKLLYAKYRLRIITSGTCSITVKGYDVRRSN